MVFHQYFGGTAATLIDQHVLQIAQQSCQYPYVGEIDVGRTEMAHHAVAHGVDNIAHHGDGAHDDAGFVEVRNRLIVAILYGTGIRRAELIGLLDRNVDTVQCQMKVHGKRDKDRIVPFGGELKRLIERYRGLRAEVQKAGVGELLLTEKGKPMYPSLVYKVVHDSLDEAGVKGKKSPHVLRHSFASAMLNHGAEINSVKEILGHESLAATQIYTHITFSELKTNYKLAHPRALKKGG